MNCRTHTHPENAGAIEPAGHREPGPDHLRPVVSALFRFQFQKGYGGLYNNKHTSFVLREEHIAELKRLVKEHNLENRGRAGPLSMSDIVNAALDFAFEHPVAFQYQVPPNNLRETLAREVYRKAFLHFVRHEVL